MLYTSVLLVGGTLAMGGVVVVGAASQFALTANAANAGSSLVERSAGTRLALVYALTPSSGACGSYGGAKEGTSLAVALYNYGTAAFALADLAVNSTLHPAVYPVIGPGDLGTYVVPLGTCAHSAGQTIFLVDSAGDGVQIES